MRGGGVGGGGVPLAAHPAPPPGGVCPVLILSFTQTPALPSRWVQIGAQPSVGGTLTPTEVKLLCSVWSN